MKVIFLAALTCAMGFELDRGNYIQTDFVAGDLMQYVRPESDSQFRVL